MSVLEQKAWEYAKSISKNDTYREYLAKAYIAGVNEGLEHASIHAEAGEDEEGPVVIYDSILNHKIK